MRFNWSVSCQLSLVPHLTLSDGVSLLHLQGHEHVCEGERKRDIRYIYLCVCETGDVCVSVRDREGVCVLLNPSVISAHLGVWW